MLRLLLQNNVFLAQDGSSTEYLHFNMYSASPGSINGPGWDSPVTIGSWQTYAARITSTSVSIYHNTVLQSPMSGLNPGSSPLSSLFTDRTVSTCYIAKSWFTPFGDGYGTIDIRALLIFDSALSDSDFDAVHQYVNDLPVDNFVVRRRQMSQEPGILPPPAENATRDAGHSRRRARSLQVRPGTSPWLRLVSLTRLLLPTDRSKSASAPRSSKSRS